jgi:transcriptional regulator with XRE-family HTH domain
MYEIYCKLKQEKGCKDADVVRATGITKSTFSDWKSGRSKPKGDKLIKIADFFGVSVEYLTTGKDNLRNDSTQDRIITKSEIINLFAGTDSVIEKFFGDEQSPENEITLASDTFVRMCKELIQNNKIGDVIPMNSKTPEERRKTRSALADWLKKERLLDGLYFDKNDYSHEELTKIKEYASFLKSQRKPLLNAAQQRTDIESPEGTDTSDNDIMDDENF